MEDLFDFYFKNRSECDRTETLDYVCRDFQINQLYNLFQDESLPDCVYIYGCTSSGKTSITTSILDLLNIKHTTINLIECYTPKILLEKIYNNISNQTVDGKTGHVKIKCDNIMDFISNLNDLNSVEVLTKCVIILDKAERLRDMNANLLPAFCRFREISHIPITFVLLSEIEFTKLIPKGDVSPPIEIYFPQYTKDELVKILTCDFLRNNSAPIDTLHNEDFYNKYLNVFLSVFYSVCRDLSELRYLAKKNFFIYCEPILNNQIDANDIGKLWRNIAPILKTELNIVYLRINSTETNSKDDNSLLHSNKNLAQHLELPFYAKYLLIAAYLASYNPAKEDKRLFMKHHGKKMKSKSGMNAKNKVTEQLNTQLGPKPFAFDRLLAIFYAILEDKVGLNSNLLVQVSSLVHLQLLTTIGDCTALDNQKYKCNVGYEFIVTVSKMVGFNIRKYLYDYI